MRLIFLLLSIVGIAACAGSSYPVSSVFYNIPVGTHVIVKQSLKILPNSGRVYLQGGKVVTLSELDQYEYNCWFLSWKVNETEQIIAPDKFIVTKVRHTDFLAKSRTTTQLATTESAIGFQMALGGPTATEYTTELTIHSDKHPDIRRLACSYWGDPGYGNHITVPQIQAALGGFVQIKILQLQKGDYEVE